MIQRDTAVQIHSVSVEPPVQYRTKSENKG